MMNDCWGIDLGGTKIEGVILNPETPENPRCRIRVPTGAEKGYDHVIGQIAELCAQMQRETGLPLPERIGMGTPGVTDPKTGLLKNANTQCLNGQPLEMAVSERLGVRVVTANDANCFALAEARLGAGRGYETMFGIILGTGVGGGLVVSGHVLSGCHGIAGEWGQWVMEPNGPVSKYGTRGTLEALIAGPALEAFYHGQSGEKRSLKEIVRRAREGDDEAASATLEQLTTIFAKAITLVIDLLDPHAIVLGGGVGNIDELYSEATRAKIASRIFNPSFETPLLKPLLGDSAGVFGAAMLVAG